jgi:hypothetical protein
MEYFCHKSKYFCHKSKGILFIADPRAKDKGNRKWWLLLKCDPEIINFYHWLAIRNGWEIVKGSRWGPHISVVTGEKPKDMQLWQTLPGKLCNFKYSINHRIERQFIWIDVQSDDLEKVRMDLGLKPKPFFSFHLTIGRFKHMME